MAFVPRLSETSPTPIQGNPWWYSNGNVYYIYVDPSTGEHTYGLPNCTCYAYGRVGEIRGEFETALPLTDAGNWYERVVSDGILPHGYEPKLGGVMCYKSISGEWAGHNAVVETISEDGMSIQTSNSYFSGSLFDVERVYRADDFRASWMWTDRDYYYQGCIYLREEPTPTPTRRNHMPVWMMLRYPV